jgi:hypothetical protein
MGKTEELTFNIEESSETEKEVLNGVSTRKNRRRSVKEGTEATAEQRRKRASGRGNSPVVGLVKKYEDAKGRLEKLLKEKERIEKEVESLTGEVQTLKEQVLKYFQS